MLPFAGLECCISRCARISFCDIGLENGDGCDENSCVEWARKSKFISKRYDGGLSGRMSARMKVLPMCASRCYAKHMWSGAHQRKFYIDMKRS